MCFFFSKCLSFFLLLLLFILGYFKISLFLVGLDSFYARLSLKRVQLSSPMSSRDVRYSLNKNWPGNKMFSQMNVGEGDNWQRGVSSAYIKEVSYI